MGIVAAKSTFRPNGNTRRIVDLVAQVRIFSAVQRSQAIIVEHAQQNVSVRTGELRGSIRAAEIKDDGKRITGSVVATADWAAFVEFGTGLTGSGTYPWDLPMENVPLTGEWIYDYKHIGWKGQAAQPYMRPALDTARGEVLEEFQR
jgi:HK97 gp10 family phage protein